ncbi:MAG: fused MFS/spermidine synthase [Pirellulales bacterium]|nr:fused MFS/spermidine synthase [Pirellulales bacterium]
MAPYALAILLGSFLLFQVQPLVGKYILPWFGGTPAVWTTCMLSFQVLLLVGYAYAHGIATWLRPRRQGMLHLVLLAGSVLLLPITPSDAWKPMGDESPTWRILCLLVASIGAPYVILASTSPLMQSWFSRTEPGRSPYRLYALSNVGSLAALVSYPFLVEPALRLGVQAWSWSIAYGAFVLLCGICAVRICCVKEVAPAGAIQETQQEPAARPAGVDQLLWLGLSACGSVLLLATTNQMCQEVAVVPFLWVLPLALYLLTFIICFDHERWYHRGVFGPLWILAIGGACAMLAVGVDAKLWLQIAVFSATMFVGCMVCHGEMVRLKPHPRYLTQFYLVIAAGGALGGVFVTLVAPFLFKGFWEYHISLLAGYMLFLAAIHRGRPAKPAGEDRRWKWIIPVGLVGLAAGGLIALGMAEAHAAVVRLRNFYGLLHVSKHTDEVDGKCLNGEYLSLRHGRIKHGFQYVDPDKKDWPTSYFGPETGVGMAIRHYPRPQGDGPDRPGLRIGVIGLGVGTLAAYGEPGDHIRFYEINPDVIRLSDEYFSYRRDSRAEVDVVLGDARISLERALAEGKPEGFDILIVDAFSSDAIPMHLLTKECFEIYWKHLKPEGILAVHISNRNLDLGPVVRAAAAESGHETAWFRTHDDEARGVDAADWILVTSNRTFLDDPAIRKGQTPWEEDAPAPLLWTDDFSNMFQVLK